MLVNSTFQLLPRPRVIELILICEYCSNLLRLSRHKSPQLESALTELGFINSGILSEEESLYFPNTPSPSWFGTRSATSRFIYLAFFCKILSLQKSKFGKMKSNFSLLKLNTSFRSRNPSLDLGKTKHTSTSTRIGITRYSSQTRARGYNKDFSMIIKLMLWEVCQKSRMHLLWNHYAALLHSGLINHTSSSIRRWDSFMKVSLDNK